MNSAIPDAAADRSAAHRRPMARTLLNTLYSLGFRADVRAACGQLSGSGLGSSVSVRQLAAEPAQRALEFSRLRASLLRGTATNLGLSDAGDGASRRVECLLRQLRRRLDAPCVDLQQLGLTVHADEMPLPAFLLMSKVLLGAGPRYVMLDAGHMQKRVPGSAEAAWTALYQQRCRRWGLRPVYAGDARTRCPLLADERSAAVLAPHGLLVPADSAWLTLEFNLCRYANSRGALDCDALLQTLRSSLQIADALFDCLHWSDRAQRQDALCNRRIAFVMQGIGDLVQLRRTDPTGINCLRELDQLVAAVHNCLWEQSRQLAGQHGLLPALAERDPCRGIADGPQRRNWQQRWHAALESAAVRHRNLLAISPYAVLPQSGAATTGFADLLPLLAHADVCGYASPPPFTGWSINEFKHFHRRAFAIMQRRNAATFVCGGGTN